MIKTLFKDKNIGYHTFGLKTPEYGQATKLQNVSEEYYVKAIYDQKPHVAYSITGDIGDGSMFKKIIIEDDEITTIYDESNMSEFTENYSYTSTTGTFEVTFILYDNIIPQNLFADPKIRVIEIYLSQNITCIPQDFCTDNQCLTHIGQIGKNEFGDELERPPLYNISNIGSGAFQGCSSLISIKFASSTPPELGENALDSDSLQSIIVFFPASANAYKIAWPSFSSIIKQDMSGKI